MEERSFIQEVAQLLDSLMEDFQKKTIQSSDEIRFYECLAEVLRSLEKTKALDNRLLIALERCFSYGESSAPIRNLRANPFLVKKRGKR